MSSRPANAVVFVHGLWVTALSWEDFRLPFEATGYEVHTPTWPLLGGKTAAELRDAPPPELGRLTLGEIVDHFETYIRGLPEPPLLVGHSFGGLFVQHLLDRGVGVAGVALNPAPIGGVVPGPVSLTGALPAIARWNGWNRPYGLTPERFARRYANRAPPSQQSAAYERYVIPTSGRVLHQAALWLGTGVSPRRRCQPLLITGSDADRLITSYVSRAAYRLQRSSPARTDYLDFAGRSHFLCNEPGWEEVAGTVIDWAGGLEPPLRRSSGRSETKV
jgi:pimeloyl-ACP methyl ester carboxylesterase